MAACPKNIFLLEPDILKTVIWVGVLVVGVIIYLFSL